MSYGLSHFAGSAGGHRAGGGLNPLARATWRLFSNGVLSPLVTSTRSGTATFFDSTGTLQNAAANTPRVSYDPANLSLGQFLLAEEQRTNSIRNNTMQGAVAGTPGTLPTNWAATSTFNGLTRTVNTGTESGIPFVEIRWSGTPTTTFGLQVLFEQNTQIAASNGQTFTGSVYCSLANGSLSGVTGLQKSVSFRDVSGNSLSGQTAVTPFSPTSSPLTQMRVVATSTATSASVAFVRSSIDFQATNGVPIDITLRIGLPQLEQVPGAAVTASSPILTFGSAVTRSADNLSVTNLAATGFNAAGSTVYVDATTSNVGALIGFDDGTTNNRFRIGQNDVNVVFVSVFNGTVQNNQFVGTHPVGTRVRAAMRLAANDFAGATNGVVQFKNAVSSVPPVTRMTIGNAQAVVQLTNGRFFQAAIAPAISDSGLQRMTRI